MLCGNYLYPGDDQQGLRFSVDESRAPENGQVSRRGVLQVSLSDPRYFEFQDGTPFVGVGFNDGFGTVGETERKMQLYEQYRMKFMRVWLSAASINGSPWSSWGSQHLPWNGYLPRVSLDFDHTLAGSDVAWRLDKESP